MSPYIDDPDFQLHVGDALEVLQAMLAESVHCCVTSPPYWGLRDYGTGSWEGGDTDCDHKAPPTGGPNPERYTPGGGEMFRQANDKSFTDVCGKCGATRVDQQLGLEATPDQYVANMVNVFREVRRVLRADGTLWLNIGDSYAHSTEKMPPHRGALREPGVYGHGGGASEIWNGGTVSRDHGLKPKDLVGIPWRLAFALQADGWCLRSDVVWSKPNPMPESVTDRPTKAHEMLFLLTKAEWKGPERTRYDDIAESDLRWIAGLLDCEGSIVIRRESPSENSYGAHAAQVSIGSTSRALLDRIAAIIGEGNVLEREGTNAPMFYWQTSGKMAYGLLRALYPHLIVKQRQARCAIHLETRKFHRGNAERLSVKEIADRDAIWEAVKSLNHFGDPDLSSVPEPQYGRWVPNRYFYDADAIREPYMPSSLSRGYGYMLGKHGRRLDKKGTAEEVGAFLKEGGLGQSKQGQKLDPNLAGRNRRSVWEIATEAYPEAHFATFPQALVEPCVKAGTSEHGCCPVCGAPWERIVEVGERQPEPEYRGGVRLEPGQPGNVGTGAGIGARFSKLSGQEQAAWKAAHPDRMMGWRPSCGWVCSAGRNVPCTVLDPFLGSGTTAQVARRLGRRCIGIELNPEYAQLAARRLQQQSLFA